MEKNEIIDILYKSVFIDEMINKLTNNSALRFDMKQELFLILLEMDDDKIKAAYNERWINYLCVNIIKKQFHSNTSPFYKNYRINNNEIKYNDEYIDDEYDFNIDEMYNDIIKWVDENMKLTDSELFKIYFKYGKYDRRIGEWRDVNCENAVSSTRKIERKLEILGIPGKRKITIDHSTISNSLRKTIKKIKEKYGNDI